ncbi:murein hydrolase activator EnvC family protein [Sulfurirhabdus autotrophica]|uniref:Septal ring factor EnvC (AmiA/AmiB activator) n=1 Tax=Sulfurirhabdus autotrophica TaxID=1706046 RepID=A0A4R3Y0K7_9PROT|nr:peptidoglycan DD-metalloendopeptidase family protein [Sulfurirhabdus autotrophica]TCV85196.1 septal ring factor EnvC (AmiA/AmiB activator) [Sulfurirhabdus autotrophica]
MYKRLFIIAIACTLTFPLHAAPKKELQDVRGRIETLKKDINTAEETRSEAADELKQSEQTISKLARSLHELSQKQNEVKLALTQLDAESQKTQNEIKTLQEQVNQILYQQYLHGPQDHMTALLNQKDPNQIARQLYYFSFIARARADLIQSLQTNLTQLASLSQRTEEKNLEMSRIRNEHIAQQKQLEAEQNSRKQVLSRIAKQIDSQRKEVNRLQRDEKRLTSLIEKLSKIAARRPPKPTPAPTPAPSSKLVINKTPDASVADTPFLRLKGKMNLPVTGELTNRFGSQREDSGAQWKGLFIKAHSGQPVKSVASGTVVFADWLRGFGNLIIVDHGNSYMSLYGNNESLYKQAGDAIRAGDTIATVGNSGGNPTAGLYFELRYQSKPFDPLSWVH